MIRQWTIVAALGVVLALLSGNFIREVVLYDPMDGISRGELAKEQEAAAEDSHGKAWGPDIKNRNLFSQYRKTSPPRQEPNQPEQVARTVDNKPVPMPPLILNGIIINPDGSFTAYIKVGDNPVVGTRIGDKMYGVSVRSIQERQVELDWQGNLVTLRMKSSPLIKKR